MSFSRFFALAESFILFILAKLRKINATSYRIARAKIAQEKSTIVHLVASHNLPQGAY